MNWKIFPVLAFLGTLPLPAFSQDSRSLAMGGAAIGVPMGPFGVYWNPALLAIPDGPEAHWVVGSGFSIFDTSNADSPILRFDSQAALQSSADPVNRFQQKQGLLTVEYQNMGGGVYYGRQLDYSSSQGTLRFFKDRSAGTLGASPYSLGYQQTIQELTNLILSYSLPFPLGNFPFLSVGGSLKYHDGLGYDQTVLTGTFTQGSSTGYQYSKTTSSTGYGLSFDLGFYGKVTDTLQVAVMLQNISSSFNWTAQKSTLSLDAATGQETVTSTENLSLSAPFPYATKVALTAAPQDKNILIVGEADFVDSQTDWRFGLERYYPETHLVARLGTFFDRVSNSQLWSFGGGFQNPFVAIDLSFVTRSLPAVQDSIAVGGALDAAVRF